MTQQTQIQFTQIQRQEESETTHLISQLNNSSLLENTDFEDERAEIPPIIPPIITPIVTPIVTSPPKTNLIAKSNRIASPFSCLTSYVQLSLSLGILDPNIGIVSRIP